MAAAGRGNVLAGTETWRLAGSSHGLGHKRCSQLSRPGARVVLATGPPGDPAGSTQALDRADHLAAATHPLPRCLTQKGSAVAAATAGSCTT